MQVWQQLQATSHYEMAAVLFGVLSVLFSAQNHVLLYPTGIISTAIYSYLFIQVGLYAESSLNAYYLIMSAYGWVAWNRPSNHQASAHQIGTATKQDWFHAGLFATLAFAGLYALLYFLTDSVTPAWDASVSALAYVGMWLLARHKLENWLWLNASNALAIPLYLYKGIPFTALLTLFLFIVAVFGYVRWRRLLRIAADPR